MRSVFEWKSRRTGMLTSNFAEAGGFLRSSPQEAIPDLQLHFVVGKLIDHGRKTVWGHGYSCHMCLLQPRSRGRVTLGSADALAPPLIDPAFLSDPEDMHKMIGAVRLMRAILSQPALQAFGGRSWRTRRTRKATRRSPPTSAITPTRSTTRSEAAGWAPARWTWSMQS